MTVAPLQVYKPMNLKLLLETIADRLNSGDLENEAQVKQSVVLPIIRALDWNDEDPKVVKPEYKVDHGYVDYAMLDHGTPHVFIEAKRMGVSLARGEDQLFGYAAHKGVPILILTDGRHWDFYLSMALGVPKERRFLRMELSSKRNASENAAYLEEFVQRDRVISGQSRRSGRKILESIRQRERARNTMPQIWSQLLQSPNQLLVSLVSKEVHAACGSNPESNDVRIFLSVQTASIEIPEEFEDITPPPPPPPGRIVGFEFKGERYETGTGVHTLARVIQLFDELNSEFMTRMEERTTSRKRKLVARERSELFKSSHLVKYSKNLGNGWWLGTNMSSSSVRQRIETACEVAGVKFGTELKLIEKEEVVPQAAN
ncbi:MAG: hypothetical protein OXB95_11740 [Rhodobacteraceae bacterium]|nr:hypothetical protein [Paracoccaceae bacterium]